MLSGKIQRNLVVVITMIVVSLVGLFMVRSVGANETNDGFSIQDYGTYLSKQNKDAYVQFSKLTYGEKQEVVDTVNNVMKNGIDSVVTSESEVTLSNNERASSSNKTVSQSTGVKVMGITLVSVRSGMVYSVKKNKVSKIRDSFSYVSKNYIPFFSVKRVSKKAWVSGGKAYFIARHSMGSTVYKGLSIKTGSFKIELVANAKGKLIKNKFKKYL